MSSHPASMRTLRRALLVLTMLLALVALAIPASAATRQYRNPLLPQIPDDGVVESCADPSVIYAEGDWYMYCTSDPLNDEDRNADGGFNFRLIPTMRSENLVDWEYVGEAFDSRPDYATPDAGIWAPEIEYVEAEDLYFLYYVVTETTFAGGGSAIGVATSDSPAGPWTHQATPVVEPHAADCCPGSRRWVFDPEVLQTPQGTDYIYYGSYFGGVSVRELEETTLDDGTTTVASLPATQKNVAVANKYEGTEVIFRDDYYYLFVSATDCCRGPLTGYSVFVGRSASPTGPFVDRSGVDLNDDEPLDDPTDARVGGTVAITFNGNRWVGPGHNTVFQDFDGHWWTIYHAVDRNDPYFEGATGFTKRPALLDRLDWVNGWPVLNGGLGPSDTPQRAPAAQPGETSNTKRPLLLNEPKLGRLIGELSDEFGQEQLAERWSWVRPPAATEYQVSNGVLRWNTQAADLFVDSNTASVLTEPTPGGNYVVETRVRLSVPAEGCCFNFVQAGLVVYGDDDNYVKLVNASIFNTRQTEWAKELAPVPEGYPRYGNSVVGPPGEWTLLRIVRTRQGGEEQYSAFTQREGSNVWERGATWTHKLGRGARIGLVSMGGSGFEAEFDYVRVYVLKGRG